MYITGVGDLQAQVNDVEVRGGGQRSLQIITLFPILSHKPHNCLRLKQTDDGDWWYEIILSQRR